jgi:hypothetical protein
MHNGRHIELIVHRDGHLEATVSAVDQPPDARMHFQQVAPVGDAGAVVMLTCANGHLRLRLNRSDLLPLSEARGETVRIEANPRIGNSPKSSYMRDDARDVCRRALEERRRRFARLHKVEPTEGRRIKTLAEQVAELQDAVQTLQALATDIRRGKAYLVPALAGQLRALIYWPNARPTWNPLLYRVADYRRMPLPIFGDARRDDELPELIQQASGHMRRLSASCVARFPSDQLIDLQDYMDMTVATFVSEQGKDERVTVQDVLGAAANTMGAAHYDETIRLDFDRLHRTESFGTSVVHTILVDLADVAAELGHFVLGQLTHRSET